MSSLEYCITEAKVIRRGYELRFRLQLRIKDSDGNYIPQSLTGFTIAPTLRLAESKDSSAVSGVSPTAPTVDNDSGVFDYLVAQADTPTLVVSKRYWGHVYVSHATITAGKDEIVRLIPFSVVA